jgi:hypothetical protein
VATSLVPFRVAPRTRTRTNSSGVGGRSCGWVLGAVLCHVIFFWLSDHPSESQPTKTCNNESIGRVTIYPAQPISLSVAFPQSLPPPSQRRTERLEPWFCTTSSSSGSGSGGGGGANRRKQQQHPQQRGYRTAWAWRTMIVFLVVVVLFQFGMVLKIALLWSREYEGMGSDESTILSMIQLQQECSSSHTTTTTTTRTRDNLDGRSKQEQ